MRVVLASASPRRRELLGLLLQAFDCLPTDIDESVRAREAPRDYVMRMARGKAAALTLPDAVVIAADTCVVMDNHILGKPRSRDEARATLTRLSARTHSVHTAVAVRCNDAVKDVLVTTQVGFAELDGELVEDYLQTAEPWDKAGSYGIQGYAGSFVRSIEGSYSAVVGLPLLETRELLASFGISPRWPRQNHG